MHPFAHCAVHNRPLNAGSHRIPERDARTLLLSPFEWTIAKRYMLPGRGEAFIAMVAGISLVAVMLGVAALVIVMSVMNGFRAELFDRILGLNGHAVVQGYGGRLDNWRQVMADAKALPGVTSALPLIEQPLMGSYGGRVEGVIVRGMRLADIRGNPEIATNIRGGTLDALAPGSTLTETFRYRVTNTAGGINWSSLWMRPA